MSLSLYSPFVSTGYSHCNHPNHIPPPSTTTTSGLPPSLRHRRRELRSVLTRSLDPMEVSGVDSEGKEFNSAQEMWREAIGEEGDETKKTQWYRDGVSYWEVSIFRSFLILLLNKVEFVLSFLVLRFDIASIPSKRVTLTRLI